MQNKVRMGESSKNVTLEYLEVLNLIVERSLVLPLVHFLEGGDFFVEPFEQMVAGFSTLPDDFRVVGLAEQGRQAPEEKVSSQNIVVRVVLQGQSWTHLATYSLASSW